MRYKGFIIIPGKKSRSAINRMAVDIIEMNNAMISERKARLIESLSSAGRIMAISYLSVATIPIPPAIEIRKVKAPKSEGVNKRVITGATRNVISCAMNVPATSFEMFLNIDCQDISLSGQL